MGYIKTKWSNRGIFGSLGSYPPSKDKLTRFHVPDTFASGKDAHPKQLINYQRFNLACTANNKGIIRKTDWRLVELLVKYAMSSGVWPILIIIKYIVLEKIGINSKQQRAVLQAELAFHEYFKLLKNKKPQFTTFFSNHVAGMLHRFWTDYMEEKNYNNRGDEINKAMKVANSMIEQLYRFSRKKGYELWIAGSMSQELVHWEDSGAEITVRDINRLKKQVDIDGNIEEGLAMHPDICLICRDEVIKNEIRDKLGNLRDSDGKKLLDIRYETKKEINLKAVKSMRLKVDKTVYFEGSKCNLEEYGLEIIEREKGTGYHKKEGTLVVVNGELGISGTINNKDIQGIILDKFKA